MSRHGSRLGGSLMSSTRHGTGADCAADAACSSPAAHCGRRQFREILAGFRKRRDSAQRPFEIGACGFGLAERHAARHRDCSYCAHPFGASARARPNSSSAPSGWPSAEQDLAGFGGDRRLVGSLQSRLAEHFQTLGGRQGPRQLQFGPQFPRRALDRLAPERFLGHPDHSALHTQSRQQEGDGGEHRGSFDAREQQCPGPPRRQNIGRYMRRSAERSAAGKREELGISRISPPIHQVAHLAIAAQQPECGNHQHHPRRNSATCRRVEGATEVSEEIASWFSKRT